MEEYKASEPKPQHTPEDITLQAPSDIILAPATVKPMTTESYQIEACICPTCGNKHFKKKGGKANQNKTRKGKKN